MSKISLFCLAPSHAQAERMVAALKAAGFSKDEISVMLPDHASARTRNPEEHAVLVAGHDTAGVLDGTLAWIDGISELSLPGETRFIAGGPIVAAMGGAGKGGITAGLVGLGLPDSEARRYDAKIRKDKILICVPASDADEVACVRAIFAQQGGEDLCVTDEISAPRPSSVPAEPSSVYYSTES